MDKLNFFSIGVYGRSSQDFFDILMANKIDTFVDVRTRRGVRGSQYAFVNSVRLQRSLEAFGINYLYEARLAPTTEVRSIQKMADAKSKTKNSERENLADTFVKSYRSDILDHFNMHDFANSLREFHAQNVVLFCVEQNHAACHRSIIALELEKELGLKSTHL